MNTAIHLRVLLRAKMLFSLFYQDIVLPFRGSSKKKQNIMNLRIFFTRCFFFFFFTKKLCEYNPCLISSAHHPHAILCKTYSSSTLKIWATSNNIIPTLKITEKHIPHWREEETQQRSIHVTKCSQGFDPLTQLASWSSRQKVLWDRHQLKSFSSASWKQVMMWINSSPIKNKRERKKLLRVMFRHAQELRKHCPVTPLSYQNDPDCET